MAKGVESQPVSENWGEKGSRWLRNFNLAVGAVALTGALVVPSPASEALAAYGVFNVAQAGFFEITRRWAAKHRIAKPLGGNALRGAKLQPV